MPVLARERRKGIVIKSFHKESVACCLTKCSSVLGNAETWLMRSTAGGHETSLSLLCSLRNYVDDSIDGIGPPDRRPPPADDFDAVDIFQPHVLDIPVDTGEQRRIDRAPIDQDQKLAGILSVETQRADLPCASIDLRHVQSGNHAQGIRDVRCPRTPDIALSNEENCGCNS